MPTLHTRVIAFLTAAFLAASCSGRDTGIDGGADAGRCDRTPADAGSGTCCRSVTDAGAEGIECDRPDGSGTCILNGYCGNECLSAPEGACYYCGDLRYTVACLCQPSLAACLIPSDCSATTPAGAGEHCGTFWWCQRACQSGLTCVPQVDAGTYLGGPLYWHHCQP